MILRAYKTEIIVSNKQRNLLLLHLGVARWAYNWAKGFPLKSKKNEKQSFRLDGSISVESDYIELPRIGKLKLAEKDYIPTDCKILSATVSKRAGKWFVSVQVETPDREISDAKNEVNIEERAI